MHCPTWLGARVAAPLAVALLAVIIGASIAQGADFANADFTSVYVSTTMLPGDPAAVLTADPGTVAAPFELKLDDDTAFPAAGQVVVFDLDLKVGTKAGQELLTYDNSTCVEGPEELCITARAKSGTANVAHPVGSTVKLATQLVTPIAAGTAGPADFLIDVTATAGFAPTAGVPGNILIDDELLEVHLIDGNTWHVAERGVETHAGNPTVAADHLANAIITTPDLYIYTLTRQEHNTATDTVRSVSKSNNFLQPFFPSVAHPFTPVGIETALNLTFGPPVVTDLAGTLNTSIGLMTIPLGTCAFSTTGSTNPPSTIQGSVTLQFDKNPLNNQVGAFGLITDDTHSWFSQLSVEIAAAGLPTYIEVVDATGAAASGQVLINAELFTYSAKDTSTTPDRLTVTSRANGGGGPAALHLAGPVPPQPPVIQTPVCDEQAVGARTDAHILQMGANAAFDSDMDGCSNWNELNNAAGSQVLGGLRDPWNHWDYMNPTDDGVNRVDDIIAVVNKYHVDQWLDPPTNTVPNPAYDLDVDRTALAGGYAWNLGPPNGIVRVDDILAQVKSYHHDC